MIPKMNQRVRLYNLLSSDTIFLSSDSAEPFVDVYENQSLTVEQLRQLTWQELEDFVPPDPNEVGEF